MSETFAKWKDKILFWAITAFVMGGVGWASWLTIKSASFTSRQEVKEMLETSTPYVRDRELIQSQVTQSHSANREMLRVIEKNTEAINALRIEIARMQVPQ